ncbi:polygalacturonase inhibitor-like [Benincasa hispida]|uniref:polygalacturonase inhibitor-like n=1 Tax=Benincasa hispida TaxID=102211 RepID=UPI00190047A5|nr:polygalacturonase inhibitor-like [Benincasa hispida]
MHSHNILFFFFFFFTISFAELCNPNDKKALLNIKKALNNPHILTSWKPGKDCCTWFYVGCDAKSHRINSLDISLDDDLSAQIPTFVGHLPFLTTLRFYKLPKLIGPIPPTIAKLHNLVQLDLSSNALSGSIPTFLGSLSNLEYLDLSSNRLTGSIPSSLANLHRLNILHLNRNKLTGLVPDSFGNFNGNIPQLYLSHNQLSGKIPASLGRVNFNFIDLSWNKLEGDGSVIFGEKKKTETINLSRNLLEFNMSKVVFPQTLNYLDLNHNKIFGEIPVEIVKLQLFFLNVSYNALCGRIPVGGEWLQNFGASSYFHNKCLCGKPLDSCK